MFVKYKNHLLVLLAAVSWATLSIFSKFASELKIDTFSQVFWRILIGFSVSLTITLLFFRKEFILNRRIIKYLFINSIFFILGFTTFTASIYLGSPIAKAVSLNFSYPLAVVFLSYIVFKDIPTPKNLLAVIISLISVILLMELWTVKNITQISAGDLFAWLNSFAFAAMIVWGAKMRKDLKINPFLILSVSWLFSLPLLIILGLILQTNSIPLFNPVFNIDFSFSGWLILLGLGTISSVLPISLMYFASSKLKPFVTSMLLLSEIIIVYLVGIFIFGQALSIWGILGMLGIMISVLLI